MSSTILFFLFIPFLAFILLGVNIIFAPHNPYMEKNSAFECGFSSFLGQNRTQFSISFFIFALLFLLFDLEILLVYPYLVSAYTNGVYGLAIMLLFLLALALGFAFELGKKALSIDSRQMFNVSNIKQGHISILGGVTATATATPINIGKRGYSTYRIIFSYSSLYSAILGKIQALILNKIQDLIFNMVQDLVSRYIGPATILSSIYKKKLKFLCSLDKTFYHSLNKVIYDSFTRFVCANFLNILVFYSICFYG